VAAGRVVAAWVSAGAGLLPAGLGSVLGRGRGWTLEWECGERKGVYRGHPRASPQRGIRNRRVLYMHCSVHP